MNLLVLAGGAPKGTDFWSLTPRIMELPRYESEGAPAGVKEAAEDGGGGPAGVVEGLSPNIGLPEPNRCPLSGVEGGRLSSSSGKAKVGIAGVGQATKGRTIVD